MSIVNWSKFGFGHHRARDFVSSEWQRDRTRVAWPYLALRTVTLLFLAANYTANLASYPGLKRSYFLIYLTNQGLTVLLLGELTNTCLVALEFFRPTHGKLEMGWHYKAFWFIINVSNPTALVITGMYWAALYNAEDGADYFNVFVHGLNSVVVLVDVIVCARPWRAHHFYISFLFGAYYALFTLFYYLAGGVNENGEPYIYTTMDWRNPGPAIGFTLLSGAAMVVFHMVLGILWWVRRSVRKKLLGDTTADGDGEIKPIWQGPETGINKY